MKRALVLTRPLARDGAPGILPSLARALVCVAIAAATAPAQTIEAYYPKPGNVHLAIDPVADSAGRLYVAGNASSDLVRIDPDGSVTVLAGPGIDLPAPFWEPSGMAVDAADNLYVACRASDSVFRFTPAGDASVVLDASGDGMGNTCFRPTSVVAVGTDVWVACPSIVGGSVFHVGASGVVTLILDAAGLGPGQTLADPTVVTDRGEVFVLGTREVFRVGVPGTPITEVIGPAGDGTVGFHVKAADLSVDLAGNVFVGTTRSVFSISPAGVVTYLLDISTSTPSLVSDSLGSTWLGHEDNTDGPQLVEFPPSGPPVVRLVGAPRYDGLVADDLGNIYMTTRLLQSLSLPTESDWLARRAPDGTVTTFLDTLGDGQGQFIVSARQPVVSPDGSTVFVVGRDSDNVMRITIPGGTETLVPTPPPIGFTHVDPAGRLLTLTSGKGLVRIDPADGDAEVLLDEATVGSTSTWGFGSETDSLGNLWISRFALHRVAPDGDVLTLLPFVGAIGRFAIDPHDTLFLVGQNDQVFEVPPGGPASIVLTTTGDGVEWVTSMQDVATDGLGNAYVVGQSTSNLYRIATDGTVGEIADPQSGIISPTVVASGWAGDVYVGSLGNDTVVHVDPSGAASTILDANGDGLGNLFEEPGDIAVDPFGSVYVSGLGTDNVFRCDPDGTITQLLDAAGLGPGAPLVNPYRLSLDRSGTLFVSSPEHIFAIRQEDWWTDLGGGSPGGNGLPTMVCKGDLTPGSSMDRVLTNVPPNALMLAWIAFQSTPFDALGGTVHAFPFTRQVLFVADATGQSSLSIPWPAGVPPGIDVYLQFIVQDLSVPDGLTLSNACVQTTP